MGGRRTDGDSLDFCVRVLDSRVVETELRVEGLSKQLEEQLAHHEDAQADVVGGVSLARKAQEGVQVAISLAGRRLVIFGARAGRLAVGHCSCRVCGRCRWGEEAWDPWTEVRPATRFLAPCASRVSLFLLSSSSTNSTRACLCC